MGVRACMRVRNEGLRGCTVKNESKITIAVTIKSKIRYGIVEKKMYVMHRSSKKETKTVMI